MRTPRDVSAPELIKVLNKSGYLATRQTGSHIRLTCKKETEHHITVPNHNPIKIGTLNSILKDVSSFLKISKEEIIRDL